MNAETARAICDRLIPGWREAPLVSGNRRVRCPLHRDMRHPNLDIHEQRAVWICRAGCGSGGAVDLARLMLGEEGAGALLRELGDELDGDRRWRRTSRATKDGTTDKPATVTDLGPPTAQQIQALTNSRRILEAANLAAVGARLVGVWGIEWLGFPTLDPGSWRVWGLDANGLPRFDERRCDPTSCAVPGCDHAPTRKFKKRTVCRASIMVSPAVREALEAGRPIEGRLYDVEGESDMLACVAAGIEFVIASTGGAGSLAAHELHREQLASPDVIVVRDLDRAGRESNEKAAAWWHMSGAMLVRILELPAVLGEKGDLRDYLLGRPAMNGTPAMAPLGTACDLEQLADASPQWRPRESYDTQDHQEQETTGNGNAGAAGFWPPMEPLPPLTEPVPTLPDALLPDSFRPWLVDAAERISIPIEYVAAPALVALGAVVGRSVAVQPKKHDDWIVVPNIWGAIVGRPGWLKSPAVHEAMRPVTHLVARARKAFADDDPRRTRDRAVLEAQIKASRKQLEKAADGSDTEKLTDASRDMAELMQKLKESVAVERRYMTQDATVEKLGELLVANPRGLLVLRDELPGWLRSLEKAGREGDREFYLEGWNGLGSFTVDRIGRGTLHIPALTVSVLGGIQPAKLHPYLSALAGRGDDGLLQRFQMLVWPDTIGEWRNADRPPNSVARLRAVNVFEFCDALDPAKLGAAMLGEIPALRFAPDTQELFDAWRSQLEQRLRSPELTTAPALESHLSKYRSLMPSLALLFHLIDIAGGKGSGAISLTAAQQAAAWCDFLEPHARKLFAAAIRPGIAGAHALAAKITAGAVEDCMTVRDLARREWAGLTREGAVHEALDVLERCHWARRETRETGGRSSDVIRLHPDLRRVRP